MNIAKETAFAMSLVFLLAGGSTMADEQKLQARIHELEKEIKRLSTQMKTEKYGLRWVECPEAFEAESENKIPILVEVPERAIKNDDGKPTHILIEGDNYHALTCLNFTHRGKIDVIYIDPPYNTGSDGFTYKDKRFLEKYPDGQKIDKNHPLRHSAWLSFMSKRLKLAKDLLSDRGVIFISIDDNEMANLKLLCDQIFGESKVEQYIWCLQDKSEGSFVKTPGLTVRKEHEYIVACFKRSDKRFHKYKGSLDFKEGAFSNPDDDPRGPWFSGNISRNGIKSTTGSKYYSITNPAGKIFTRNWTLSKSEYEQALTEGRIFFANGGKGVPRLKIYQSDAKYLIQSSLIDDVHTSVTGKNELKDIFGEAPFNFPKPTSLIMRLLEISLDSPSSIVLDFFAGSGTTAHAVMKLNAHDGGSRQCILVQQREGDANICEKVTYERNRRVIEGYKNAKGEDVAGLGGSLKYYKTSFVGKHRSGDALDEDRSALAAKAGALLALAEDTLDEEKLPAAQTKYWQHFSDGAQRHTMIYFSDDLNAFEALVKKADQIRAKDKAAKIAVYVFAIGSVEGFENEFDDMRHIALKPIPDPILAIYKAINGD